MISSGEGAWTQLNNKDIDIVDVEDELDNFFQSDDGNGLTGSDKQFDFYRPGEAGGFSELNTFTMNAYKMLVK